MDRHSALMCPVCQWGGIKSGLVLIRQDRSTAQNTSLVLSPTQGKKKITKERRQKRRKMTVLSVWVRKACVCVGVSALRVNLFFQTPLNYRHITLPRAGQGYSVIVTAKQVWRDRRVFSASPGWVCFQNCTGTLTVSYLIRAWKDTVRPCLFPKRIVNQRSNRQEKLAATFEHQRVRFTQG